MCSDNFLEMRPNRALGMGSLLIISAEVAFLGLQKLWGPAFFLPQKFQPERYTYIRKIVKALVDDGSTSSSSTEIIPSRQYVLIPHDA